MFQFQPPLPYHITAASRTLFYRQDRPVPSPGLDHTQIGEAIQAVGLVAEPRTYRKPDKWGSATAAEVGFRMQEQLLEAKGFLYAYLRLGLPILLFLLLDGRQDQGHLIRVTGYRLAAISVLATKACP